MRLIAQKIRYLTWLVSTLFILLGYPAPTFLLYYSVCICAFLRPPLCIVTFLSSCYVSFVSASLTLFFTCLFCPLRPSDHSSLCPLFVFSLCVPCFGVVSWLLCVFPSAPILSLSFKLRRWCCLNVLLLCWSPGSNGWVRGGCKCLYTQLQDELCKSTEFMDLMYDTRRDCFNKDAESF